MSNTTDFADRVISRFARTITDGVFLLIQNDHELMHDYLRLVESEPGGLNTVNSWIGRRVRERFNLQNEPDRQDKPVSTLIQSYTQHD